MNRHKQKAFGLDIGTSSLKAVWLAKAEHGFFLESARAIPAPARGIASESPLDQEELAKALRLLISEAKISTRYVTIALPENQVYTKVIETPILSDKELA